MNEKDNRMHVSGASTSREWIIRNRSETIGSIMDSLEIVREAVFGAIVRTGRAPNAGSVAAKAGLSLDQVRSALRALADAHVIALGPGGESIRIAPPFAAGKTRYRVRSGQRSWYAPCAWDAFGIPAALHVDAEIDACCAHSHEPIECGVRGGTAYGKGVVHLLVPAARFWDDIVYT